VLKSFVAFDDLCVRALDVFHRHICLTKTALSERIVGIVCGNVMISVTASSITHSFFDNLAKIVHSLETVTNSSHKNTLHFCVLIIPETVAVCFTDATVLSDLSRFVSFLPCHTSVVFLPLKTKQVESEMMNNEC